jgi:transposase
VGTRGEEQDVGRLATTSNPEEVLTQYQVANRRRRGSRGGRPPAFHREIYKSRNTVERAINKLKAFRAVATRYDKRDYMYQATIDIATMKIWLRDLTRNRPAGRDPPDTP